MKPPFPMLCNGNTKNYKKIYGKIKQAIMGWCTGGVKFPINKCPPLFFGMIVA